MTCCGSPAGTGPAVCPFPPKYVAAAPYPVGQVLGVVVVAVCPMHLHEVCEHISLIEPAEVNPLEDLQAVEAMAAVHFPDQVYRMVPAAA